MRIEWRGYGVNRHLVLVCRKPTLKVKAKTYFAFRNFFRKLRVVNS